MSDLYIKVSEIFGPTIQGEGVLVGLPTVFVRTGGCDFRCSWCDSLHAVDSKYRFEWKQMSSLAIFEEIQHLSNHTPLVVSLSGGNPAIQPLAELIKLGHSKNYKFALETQGSIAQPWFKDLDILTLSPKPPSSGMPFDLQALEKAIAQAGEQSKVIFKFVILDDEDFDFAYKISTLFPDIDVYLQPCNHTPAPADKLDSHIDLDGIMDRMRWLIDKTIKYTWYNVRILPQLHTLIWGNKRGV